MQQLLISEIGEKWIQPELKLVLSNTAPLVSQADQEKSPGDPSVGLPNLRPKPFRKRRSPGEGAGYIQLHYCKKQTKSGIKSYEQYYYHYELDVKGKRVKRSAYIPKDKFDVVLEWERNKVVVTAILFYLGKSV